MSSVSSFSVSSNFNLGSRNANDQGSAAGTLPLKKNIDSSSMYQNYAAKLILADGKDVDFGNLDKSYSTSIDELSALHTQLASQPAQDNKKLSRLTEMGLNQLADLITNFSVIDADLNGELSDIELKNWLTSGTIAETETTDISTTDDVSEGEAIDNEATTEEAPKKKGFFSKVGNFLRKGAGKGLFGIGGLLLSKNHKKKGKNSVISKIGNFLKKGAILGVIGRGMGKLFGIAKQEAKNTSKKSQGFVGKTVNKVAGTVKKSAKKVGSFFKFGKK